jgi:cytochrome c-type biogenesis protein CcmH
VKRRVRKIRDSRSGIILGSLIIAAFLALFATAASAQGPSIDDEVNRVGKTLYCPVCPNTPLDQCNTQACVQWRAQIKEMLQSGKTESQIRDYFVSQYGDRVLGEPPAQGFNWLAYVLPVFGVLFGGAVVWFGLRNRMKVSPEQMPVSNEYADRIEKELKEE